MIETVELSKHYGATAAVGDVSLSVPSGSVYGLVGPNGAGKTTLLGLLAGLRQPTSGRLHIDVSRDQMAVLSDTPRFDSWLTGREVIQLAQRLGDETGTDERVDQVLAEVGLADAATRRTGGYSRGMLQRLGIGCTIVGNPKLVLLDEPASALDPQGRREVLDLIVRFRGSATVLFSSHILSDVQEVCDTVGVLNEGRLLFQGPLESLLVGAAVPRYLVRLRPPLTPVATALQRHDWIESVVELGPDELAVQVRTLEDAEVNLPSALAATGARVVSLAPEAVSLERAFLELTQVSTQ